MVFLVVFGGGGNWVKSLVFCYVLDFLVLVKVICFFGALLKGLFGSS